VKQAGSLVDPGHLRFDFSPLSPPSPTKELQDIEDLMNKHVLRNTPVDTIENVPIDVAINEYKAMALVRRKIWRPRARGEDRRVLHRTLRRHAHARHRGRWPDQDP